MIDPVSLGGFLGFLNFETCRCPNCGTVLTRDEVTRNMDSHGSILICPRCNCKIDIDELENTLQ